MKSVGGEVSGLVYVLHDAIISERATVILRKRLLFANAYDCRFVRIKC